MTDFIPYAGYIQDGDIVYVELRDTPIDRPYELDAWCNVDLAADGSVVAIEFVNATDTLILSDVPERETVERLIRAAGIQF